MHTRKFQRRGFTLIEAVVATSLTALAGSALLLGVSSSMQTINDVRDQAIAAGMAQQLMDEIVGNLYSATPADAYQQPLGPSAWEAGGVCRERFNDIDDFTGFTAKPPKDAWGVLLGNDDGVGGTRNPNFQVNATFFANWRQQVSIYYVGSGNFANALPNGQTSDYRAIEVRIFLDDPVRGAKQLALARRVVAYVPVP